MRVNRHALTEWRENRGFSKSELARQAEISLPYLCDLESGHRPGSPPVITRLADVLKVNVHALIENPNALTSGKAS